MNLKKLIALLLAVCMLASMLAACGGGNDTPVNEDAQSGNEAPVDQDGEDAAQPPVASEPQYGGHLNMHSPAGILGIDPVFRATVWYYTWLGAVYEGPLTRDADNQIAPGACDYELSEDKLTLKLWPREGLLFHDGTPVEAEDVMASITRAMNLGNSVNDFVKPAIKEMTVTDNVLTINFNYYSEACMSRIASYQTWMGVMPKEICEQYATKEFKTVDAVIGTGPYKMTAYTARTSVTIERFDGYVPVEEGRTGYAGVKHAYLDSITVWENTDYSSATMAMLAGQYDLTDVIETEYQDMAAAAGINRQKYNECNTVYMCYFNNDGGPNLCAKYPALRKAIMAAIDMDEFANTVGDNAVKVEGRPPVLEERFQTDYYLQTDWYGPKNQDAVDKYLDEARAAGYKDEPVQIVASALGTSTTMLIGALENAGINYEVVMMDATAAAEFYVDSKNNWDLKFDYQTGAMTPGSLSLEMTTMWYGSEKRDELVAKLQKMDSDSQEYMDTWHELHQLLVDDCTIVIFGFLDWYWCSREGLHVDYEGPHPYLFNAYWDDPSQHPG